MVVEDCIVNNVRKFNHLPAPKSNYLLPHYFSINKLSKFTIQTTTKR